MKKNIFVNNHGMIELYEIKISEKKMKYIQSLIDEYYGKGAMMAIITHKSSIKDFSDLTGKKIELVSKEYIGRGTIFPNCSQKERNTTFYEYKFYAYKQSKLSMLIDKLLKEENPLYLSDIINQILVYSPNTKEEEKYIEMIKNCIKYSKVKSANNETLSLLRKIKENLLNNYKQRKKYHEMVDDEIRNIESCTSPVFESTIEDENKSLFGQKKKIKSKILRSIPTAKIINKNK